ncbi:MAG: hypothetical protein ABH950_07260 [Candidatus Altiarchaeota archaeon]
MDLTDEQELELKKVYLDVDKVRKTLEADDALEKLLDEAFTHKFGPNAADITFEVNWDIVFDEHPTCPSCKKGLLEDADEKTLGCMFCGFKTKKELFEKAKKRYEKEDELTEKVRALKDKAAEIGVGEEGVKQLYKNITAELLKERLKK